MEDFEKIIDQKDKVNTIWNEKYRPQILNDFIGNEKLKESIKKQLERGDIQNYIFYGSPGGGKTTLAKIIVNNLDCEYMMINASDERSIDVIRDKIKGFASTASFKPLKVVVMDECLTGDTLVAILRDGEFMKIPIKELNENLDLVKSFNFDKNEIEWKPFCWMDKGIRDLYEIIFENNEIVRCTGEHKWFVMKDGERKVVKTMDLIEEDEIISPLS